MRGAIPLRCARALALCQRSLSRQGDWNLVEAYRVFENQSVERRFTESRLRGSVSHRLGVRPRAVETREVAGPQEVAQANLGHAPETALFLDLEGEEDLALDELGRLVGKRDVGLEDGSDGPAEIVLPVEAPEQKRDPPDTGLFEHEAHPGMTIANARENDGAHQLRHEPHREVRYRHQRLVARFEARDPHPDLARPTTRIGVQVDRQARLGGGRPDRLPHLV